LHIGDNLVIELHYSTKGKINSPYFWISIESQFGALFGANSLIDGIRPEFIEKEGIITCVFNSLHLYPQTFTIWAGVRASDGHTNLTTPKEIGQFHIVSKVSDLGLNGVLAESLAISSSPFALPYKWIFNNGDSYEFNILKNVKQ
jgi:hypothetical protein